MNVLGINFGHDSAATIIRDGKIILSIEEEKISRIKQDFGWPEKAVNELLLQCNLKKEEIDVIAFGGFSFSSLGRNEIRYRFNKIKSLKNKEYLDRILSYSGIKNKRFEKSNEKIFSTEIHHKGFINAKITFFNHHLCHAASAFYCSPFTPDLTITCDGHGDGESFNFYMFKPESGLTPLVTNDFTTSIGAFYSCITQLLGFRPTRHEGKITGLAAYGKPTKLVDDFLSLFQYDNEKLTRYPFDNLKIEWNKYNIERNLSFTQKINLHTSEAPIGVEYAKRQKVLLSKITEMSKGYTKEDISFACQKVAEQIVVNETKRVLDKFFKGKATTIALAGGVFANVRINQMIYELPEVTNLFIQPAMGDSGLSLGAGILADIKFGKRTMNTAQYKFEQTYFGPNYNDQIEKFIESISNQADVIKMQEPSKEIAQMMKDNLVVGYWEGSMEWGPRALGKRSMILNTFDKTVNDSVNKRLSRTEFMPFAPSIIDFMMKTYIPTYDPNCPAADYMTMTYDVAKEFHEELQAVVHVDGTARPQNVRKETNPKYYDIINEFYKLTGCGAIVNTSFNAHEEPIVSTPESAYKALQEDRIDVLVLDNYKIVMK